MRISSHGEIACVDLTALHRLTPALWAEWRGLCFDARGSLLEPDTGETSPTLRLAGGRHRTPGARYVLTTPGRADYTFTLLSDDGRTVRGTLAAALWTADVEIGERWSASGRVDVRALLQANEVPGPVISLIGGRDATVDVTLDPSALEHRGDLVTGSVRAQRAKADGVLQVVTKSRTWRCHLTMHLHGQGVLGRIALLGARPAVRRGVRQALTEFWSDASTEVASLASGLATLDGQIADAGGPDALVHRELWRALREVRPARAEPATADPAPAVHREERRRGLSRRYERPVEIDVASADGAEPDPGRLRVTRDADGRVSARGPSTSRYRTPPRFTGHLQPRAGRTALVGTIRESWGNTVPSRVYAFATAIMIFILGLGIASPGGVGSQRTTLLLLGGIGTVLFALLCWLFRSSRRPDFDHDAGDLEDCLRAYLVSLAPPTAAPSAILPPGRETTPPPRPDDDPDFERLWRRVRVLGAVAVVPVLGTSVFLASRGTSTSRSAASTTVSLPPPEKLPHDHLTGVGATIAGFAAAHGPALEHGDFGPTFSDGAGGRTATYNTGNSTSDDIVDTLIHDFPAGTAETAALADIRAHDLPADAHLVRTVSPDRTCHFVVYRSAILAGSGPYEDFGDGTIVVQLESHIGRPYSAADVQFVVEYVGPTATVDKQEC